jgi:hypothetical protein
MGQVRIDNGASPKAGLPAHGVAEEVRERTGSRVTARGEGPEHG